MANILSIETSGEGCSVAIHSAGKLIIEREQPNGKSSSSQLTVLIEELWTQSKIDKHNLDAIAVSAGPGSYTGLRIGTSTAKGICFGLDLPLLAIDTLDVIAYAQPAKDNYELICPMLDARRMEVYCKVIEITNFKEVLPTQAKVLSEGAFEDLLTTSKILFCGPGAQKFDATHLNIVKGNFASPKARDMGMLAYNKYKTEAFEDLIAFEPVYLKDFLVKKSKKRMPLDL